MLCIVVQNEGGQLKVGRQRKKNELGRDDRRVQIEKETGRLTANELGNE